MSEADKIKAIEETAAAVGGEVYPGYSGRGMYGEAACYGIDCADPDACVEEAASRGLWGAKTDQLGKGYIVYWPSVKAK